MCDMNPLVGESYVIGSRLDPPELLGGTLMCEDCFYGPNRIHLDVGQEYYHLLTPQAKPTRVSRTTPGAMGTGKGQHLNSWEPGVYVDATLQTEYQKRGIPGGVTDIIWKQHTSGALKLLNDLYDNPTFDGLLQYIRLVDPNSNVRLWSGFIPPPKFLENIVKSSTLGTDSATAHFLEIVRALVNNKHTKFTLIQSKLEQMDSGRWLHIKFHVTPLRPNAPLVIQLEIVPHPSEVMVIFVGGRTDILPITDGDMRLDYGAFIEKLPPLSDTEDGEEIKKDTLRHIVNTFCDMAHGPPVGANKFSVGDVFTEKRLEAFLRLLGLLYTRQTDTLSGRSKEGEVRFRNAF